MDFFITGFPRSKTAWFANYFTYNKSFCFHEEIPRSGLQKVSDCDDLRRFKESLEIEKLGNSDSSSCIYWDYLIDFFPRAKWVIVDRNIDDVEKSLLSITNIPEKIISKTNIEHGKKLNEVKNNLDPFIIPFDFSVEQIAGLHDFLEIDFCPERFILLNSLNVSFDKNLYQQIEGRLTCPSDS